MKEEIKNNYLEEIDNLAIKLYGEEIKPQKEERKQISKKPGKEAYNFCKNTTIKWLKFLKEVIEKEEVTEQQFNKLFQQMEQEAEKFMKIIDATLRRLEIVTAFNTQRKIAIELYEDVLKTLTNEYQSQSKVYRNTVFRIMKKLGDLIIPKHEKSEEFEKKLIHALRHTGASTRDLATIFNKSTSTIHKILKEPIDYSDLKIKDKDIPTHEILNEWEKIKNQLQY